MRSISLVETSVLAGKAQFTPQEQAGYALFRGKAQCNNCHRDGGPGEDPLFTDFTASNIGTPANPMLPYYAEQRPDARGYAANPAGSRYVDPGVGGFLTERNLLSHPSAVDARWRPLTAENMGRFQVPTLRNVDKRPYPEFVKAYGHNGYFKSSSRSCTSITRATFWGAAGPMIRRGHHVLAPLVHRQHEHKDRGTARAVRRGRKCTRELHADAHRRLHATVKRVARTSQGEHYKSGSHLVVDEVKLREREVRFLSRDGWNEKSKLASVLTLEFAH